MAKGRGRTTLAAATLALVITAAFIAAGLDLLLTALDPDRLSAAERSSMVSLGLPTSSRETSTLALISGVAVTVVSLVAVVVVVGILSRRDWAREAGIGFFAILGIILGAVALGGLLADPPASGAALGMALAVGQLGVAGLLLTHQTEDDFARAAMARARKRRGG